MRSKIGTLPPCGMPELGGGLELLFDRDVFFYILNELRKHPTVEDGGKYVGYVSMPGDRIHRRYELNPRSQGIVITDFLPGGPNARRTAVEFVPDGEYQETLFRQAEKIDPAIEHLGSWHSHHCNGLQTLSFGDVRGYLRTVKKPLYRPEFFIASLVKRIPNDPEDHDWIDHFLFVRGADKYYLATDHIRIVDLPTVFGAYTGHSPRHREHIEETSAPNTAKKLSADPPCIWYDTEEGRNTLAEDKCFFREQFGPNVVATRRDSQITLTGRTESKTISVTYPRNLGDREICVSVRQHGIDILRMHCELSHRKISFTAALAAARAL